MTTFTLDDLLSSYGPTNYTFAVGDIHGRYDALQEAMKVIKNYAKDIPHKIIFLGDYIDRGPESRKVVEFLKAGSKDPNSEWICLKGNHEDMAVTAHLKPDLWNWWIRNGGETTVSNYENKRVDDGHLAWFNTLPDRYIDRYRFFCHAGAIQDVAPEDQKEDNLLWQRVSKDTETPIPGYYIVHGHTPFRDGPVVLESRINLDTMGFATGRIGVAVFDDGAPGKAIALLEARAGYDTSRFILDFK